MAKYLQSLFLLLCILSSGFVLGQQKTDKVYTQIKGTLTNGEWQKARYLADSVRQKEEETAWPAYFKAVSYAQELKTYGLREMKSHQVMLDSMAALVQQATLQLDNKKGKKKNTIFFLDMASQIELDSLGRLTIIGKFDALVHESEAYLAKLALIRAKMDTLQSDYFVCEETFIAHKYKYQTLEQRYLASTYEDINTLEAIGKCWEGLAVRVGEYQAIFEDSLNMDCQTHLQQISLNAPLEIGPGNFQKLQRGDFLKQTINISSFKAWADSILFHVHARAQPSRNSNNAVR